MTRVKLSIYALASLLAIFLGTLVTVQPASAATWIYSGDVAMGVNVSGRHISTATVELEASPGIPTTLSVHFDGYGSNGLPTGPQLSYTWSCQGIVCAHQFNVNHTYPAGSYVYGWVEYDGAEHGGVPVYSF
jgi:hypothetical protein